MSAQSGSRPNIVLIMSDQHNPHIMGCAGDAYIRTPNLDALAREGALFTNMYCPHPLCTPSRMAFLTARYPSSIGVHEIQGILSSHIPTFAHSLGAAGYEAVLCGRMHFNGHDQFHGFEKRLVGDVHDSTSRTELDVLTPEIRGSGSNATNGQSKYAVEVSGYGKTGFQFYDRTVTEKACEFIATRRAGDRPHCLVIGFVLPHNPLICSREWFDYYMDAIPTPAPVREVDLHPAVVEWRKRRGCDDLTPRQIHRGLAAYYGLISQVDRNVGAVIDAVRASSQADNTIVVYSSDHGDMAYEHGMWWKSNLYEGAVGVPFIISWPERFPRGAKLDPIAGLIDVGPTLLDIAGAPELPDAEGRSFAGFLLPGRDTSDWPNETFAEYLGLLGDRPACMIRTGPWKLIYYDEFKSCQLFNLQEDPGELNDRARDPACTPIVAECLEKIRGRWSAEAMLEGAQKSERARQLLLNCGHDAIPHPVTHGIPEPERHNEFDFEQLERGGALLRRQDETR